MEPQAKEEQAIGAREDYMLEQAEQWAAEGLITREQLAAIQARYRAPAADVRRVIVVRAALVTGVLLLLLGAFRLFADLQLGPGALTAVQAVLALACVAAGWRMRRERPAARGGHALIYLGAMFYLGAIGLGGYTLEVFDRANAPWLLFLGGLVVAPLGWGVRFDKLHGIGVALLAAAAAVWLHRAGLSVRWAVMAVATAVFAVGALAGGRMPPGFRHLYMVGGVVAAVGVAWVFEVTASEWAKAPYALLLTLWAALPLAVGIREGDDTLAALGIGLVVLDIYTQYYVLFWQWAPRTLFFLVGGALTLGFGIAYERALHGKRPSALGRREPR